MPLFLLAGMFFPSAPRKRKATGGMRHWRLRGARGPGAASGAAGEDGGQLWKDEGLLANIASDYKAHHAGDLVQIVITQSTVAQNTGSGDCTGVFSANSGD